MFVSGAASSVNKSNSGNNDDDGGGGGADTHVRSDVFKLHILFRRFTNCNRQLTTLAVGTGRGRNRYLYHYCAYKALTH